MNSDNGITISLDHIKIKICQNVIESMRKYIQKGCLSKEAGGILIGKENMSNENLIINNITVPMKNDKRKYNRFFRNDEGHIAIFNELYKTSNKTVRYVGEWHTHPEAIPHCSSLDSNTWEKISVNSSTKYDFYYIIIGYKAIRVWIVKYPDYRIELIGTIFWKDV